MRIARPLVALLCAVALLAAYPAAAFGSLPPGASAHEEITGEAGAAAGFPEDALDALQDAVVAPDASEMKVEPDSDQPDRIDADEEYDPSHHCDRVPPATNEDAFAATAVYVQQQLDMAESMLRDDEGRKAMDALGRALHAFQDCFSHSSIATMGPDQQRQMARALLGNGSMPAGLQLTGFLPESDDPEHPPGDLYPHGEFALDAPGFTPATKFMAEDGRTRYEVARDLAKAATAALLAEFVGNLDATEKGRLFDVKQRLVDKLPTPSAGIVVLAVGILAASAFVARFKRD